MTDLEKTQRQAVVAEARSWLRTPYRHLGRIKGKGVDCAMLLLEVYERAGLIPHHEADWYTPRWSDKKNAGILLGILREYARPVESPLPADVALYRIGKRASHLGIVLEWPGIVHSLLGIGVVLDDAEANESLKQRFLGFYRFNGWE